MRKVTAACLLLLALCLGARAEAEKEAYVVSTDGGMPIQLCGPLGTST